MTSAPQLDMLWESADPAAALTTRFGFTDAGQAASWLMETLHDEWGLGVEHCDRLVISASKLLAWLRVDGERLVAKSAVNAALFARLADVDALTGWLHDQGIPVADPIPAADGRIRVEREGLSLGLYPFVDGKLLDADNVDQVETAGRMLARLHDTLALYPRPFAGAGVAEDQQLVHGDFRSANILQDGTGITAILDFDDAAHRGRAWELGRSAVLLATRYHDWQPTSPATRNRFVAAYNELSPPTGDQFEEFNRAVAAVSDHFGWGKP